MADILVVEDNEEIGGLLSDFLRAEGYDTYLALDGEEALELYEAEGAKLVLLDLVLPGLDGFAVCSRIRDNSNTPIIILSARDSKEDKLNGLLLGADDYMEKPYDIDILLAKIQGIMKRRYSSVEIVDGELRLDKAARRLFRNGQEVLLTAKEFDLLLYLMENKGKVIGKEELFCKIWGFDSRSEPQTLTVHIKWLREKLEHNPKKPEHILTVWGVGYRYIFEGEG
ncbi:DNA-binding response regulator [Lachnospiraceae bacterium]|nr:DNA-binding response regulator [Lachnospiraceae bacterium]